MALSFPLKTLAAGTLLALAATSFGQTRSYLNIGDAAPPLRPARWLKGGAIPSFQPGHVYVVEFWATWCGPCKENIPHLTEMAKRFAGKVDIVGVDAWESNDPTAKGTLAKVAAFVKAQGPRMDYHVAADAADNHVVDAWMKRAGEGGLPTSFIVGKDGKIAWIGPPAKLEDVLSQVVDDRFDVAAARASRATEVEVTRPIQEAREAKAWARLLKLTDAQIAKRPGDERLYAYDRLTALFHTDLPAAKAKGDAILDTSNGEIGAYQMLASIFASQKELSPEAYRYGLTVIDRVPAKNDHDYLFLAMKAEVQSSLGMRAEAVESQTAAVKAAEANSHAPKEFVEFLRKNLARFQAAKIPAQG